MSKYVKNLITEELRSRLEGVKDALVVNMIGLTSNQNNLLRTQLAEKGVRVMIVKNSMAQAACEGTPLEPLFSGTDGTNAVCWGGEDIVSLAKAVVEAATAKKQFPTFEARCGIMDGDQLTATQVVEVSKWPTREEQVSLLVGQICGPGGQLAGQIAGPGGALASQINEKAGGEDSE
jgi:large subunit ribosomal protein L10